MGRFDIVLFMGVLYHLKHPLLALERVCALATEMAAVDSFILREEHRPGENVDQQPVMEFYETNEFGGQTDNWVAPSLSLPAGLLPNGGFREGGTAECVRIQRISGLLSPLGAAAVADAPQGPELVAASHNRSGGVNFDSSRDELVSAWFRWNARSLGSG